MMKKDYWLIIGVVALGIYFWCKKKEKTASLDGNTDIYGKERLLINL
jgi:hypothetical protein